MRSEPAQGTIFRGGETAVLWLAVDADHPARRAPFAQHQIEQAADAVWTPHVGAQDRAAIVVPGVQQLHPAHVHPLPDNLVESGLACGQPVIGIDERIERAGNVERNLK